MGTSMAMSSAGEPDNSTNPNPKIGHWDILRHSIQRDGYVLEVLYHDCTNFEGRKILVFAGQPPTRLESLDPHFFEESALIARFRPTHLGWDLAVNLVKHSLRAVT
jgi:hypothetical protein